MGDLLRIILLVIPLIAGAVAIFLSFQLMKRYSVSFVNSYFYYLVFLYIFGAYTLAGSGILEYIFGLMEVEERVVQSSRLFSIFLGIPFLVLALFMLIRSVQDFFQKKVRSLLIGIYFILGLLAFFLYGFFTVRLSRFEQGEYETLITVQQWGFLALSLTMYTLAFLLTFLQSRSIPDHGKKRFIRIFGLWYLLYMILTCTAFLLISLHLAVPHIFIFIFLAWHLIPILFLNLYLEKYHGNKANLQEDFESKLTLFVEKYEISKREREVIQLICRGLSNQEIGDSLFISLQTVKDHIHRIFVKTGVKNRVQLTNMIRST
jgi:DNA-binding CsgD family transcriptional regulator